MTTGNVDEKRLIFPSLARLYETFSPASYSFMRFAAGAVLVPHGIQKIILGVNLAPYIEKQMGLPSPVLWSYLAIFAKIRGRCLSCNRTLYPRGGIDSLRLHGCHRHLLPMAIRLFLDQQGLRIRLAMVLVVPRHLLPRRWPLFGRSIAWQRVLVLFRGASRPSSTKAAAGGESADPWAALQMVLMLEGVEYRLK